MSQKSYFEYRESGFHQTHEQFSVILRQKRLDFYKDCINIAGFPISGAQSPNVHNRQAGALNGCQEKGFKEEGCNKKNG